MDYRIVKPDRDLFGEIQLPPSKSISNRLLIMQALSGHSFQIKNLSESDDTISLKNALIGYRERIDAGHAGTTMRFLTAYLSQCPGKYFLTGSDRMKKRPIGELVDALRQIGAEIEYPEKKGFPPLVIHGKSLPGGQVSIDSSISSQFISALLMIAPCLRKGLDLNLEGKIMSSSYIRLTLNLMNELGIEYDWIGNRIVIKPQVFKSEQMEVEADWSAASYWYEMATLAENVDLLIKGLSSKSYQGDAILSRLFNDFGIVTEYFTDGIRIKKGDIYIKEFNYDFTDHPDLVQTLSVVCTLKNIPFRFTGTETLRIKETDRIYALKNELGKLKLKINTKEDGSQIYYDGRSKFKPGQEVRIRTYQDHRMAMAFAPVALVGKSVVIEDSQVVSKSYPGFWDDLKKTGFQVQPI